MTSATFHATPEVSGRRSRALRDDLSLRRLEVLVRLHRRDLDGAGAELLDALDTRRDDLARCLGIESSQLPHPGGEEQLPLLTALIEARLVALKGAAAETRIAEARQLAQRLSSEAVRAFDGVELDVVVLRELVATPGFDVVEFRVSERRLGIGRVFLAAVLREVRCERLLTLRVAPDESSLHVGYEGDANRGWLRLSLQAPEPRHVPVVVDLETAPLCSSLEHRESDFTAPSRASTPALAGAAAP